MIEMCWSVSAFLANEFIAVSAIELCCIRILRVAFTFNVVCCCWEITI
jgi:hypothetical protein